ncbi:MAG TPA: glutamate-5-semialdehyde dehydrogenase, partial [Phycisphaerae bacterium]|nr:glutamate-5-semialdehyde dehydrogenase [Phycisphaerae bacterium]
MDAKQYIETLARSARRAAAALAVSRGAQRDAALRAAAGAIRDGKKRLRDENLKDLARSEEYGLSAAMVQRLTLSDKVIESMATALEEMAAQVDPVGRTIAAYNRPNGLRIEKRRVPIGVVGIIFESRPNVTSDAAGLCLKSSNACILRGGKEALHSNLAIAAALREGVASAGLPAESVAVIDNPDRAVVPAMATAEGLIDLIIPRGGKGLIRAVTEAATIPVIKHYDGICHQYVADDADIEMAVALVVDSKCEKVEVCNALETL